MELFGCQEKDLVKMCHFAIFDELNKLTRATLEPVNVDIFAHFLSSVETQTIMSRLAITLF